MLIKGDAWKPRSRRKKIGRPRTPKKYSERNMEIPDVYKDDTYWLRPDKCDACVTREGSSFRDFKAIKKSFFLQGHLFQLREWDEPDRALCVVNNQLVFLV